MKTNNQTNYKNIYGSLGKHENTSARYTRYRREWNENPKQSIISNFPLNVDIELTNACNLKCPHCARTSNNWGDNDIGFMDEKIVKKILDEIKKEKGYCVKFSLRGEPLIYKDIIKILKYAKKSNLEEFYFNTNGTLLNKKLSEELVKLQLPRISISVGGWDKDSFEKIQRGANFEKVYENIRYLKKYRDINNSKFPQIRLQVVLTPEIKKNIKKIIKFWKDVADEIGGIEFREEDKEIIDSGTKSCKFKCNFLWQRLIVLWDGAVYPCLFHGVKVADDLTLGNIKDKSLKEFWNSTKLESIRQAHINGTSGKIKSCSVCSYRLTEVKKLSDAKQ